MAETAVLHYVLTARRTEILSAVGRWRDEHGYCPTVREIQLTVGLASVSTVHAHLAILRDARLVEWVDGSNRTLRLTDLGAGFVL